VFDLPPVGLHVVEHRAERRRCACGQVTAADFPAQARASACYGPGVQAIGVYLGAWQHLPVARGAELLGHLLSAPVSSGWLSGLQAEAAVALTGFAAHARTVLADAEVVHVDETDARVAGRLHWVHSTSTPRWSWYRVDAKRGKQAVDAAGVLPAFAGVAVHDFWSPYWHYPNAAHAVCAAHLLRELEEAAAEPGQGWAGKLAEWLTVAIGIAAQARAGGAERLDAASVANLLGRYDQIIATGHAANPPSTTPWPAPAQTTGGSVPAGAAGHPPHRGLPVPGRPARPTHQQPGRA
jgi:transposase